MNEINAIVLTWVTIPFLWILWLVLSGISASSAQRPKIHFQIAFFCEHGTCFSLWVSLSHRWMTGHGLVCRLGTLVPFRPKFCSFILETGARQPGNWARPSRRRCLGWSGQVGWRVRAVLWIHALPWKLCEGRSMWYSSALKGCIWGCTLRNRNKTSKQKQPNQSMPKTGNGKGLT